MTFKFFSGALVLALALAPLACRREEKVAHVQKTEEEASPRLAASVPMGDLKLEPQLLNGFYTVENGWRWTAKQFTVQLRAPADGGQKGAHLKFDLSVPDVVIQKLKSVTLTATAGDTPLPPETYTKSGAYSFERDVPPAALGKSSIRIDFKLDKAMPPAGGDKRELGIIANSVSLDPK